MSTGGASADDLAPNFVHELIEGDLADGKLPASGLRTRFPPEPNGYLHFGHAKSIVLNFGSALKYGGLCNLRFDDTNPTKEEQEYVESIKESVRWLGYTWDDRLYFASDYFEQLYQWAERLIEADKAYVDESTADEIKSGRGDFYRSGQASRYRDRPPAESLALFRRMRKGEFADGAMVLRAKIDMGSGNINLRDPPMYRILHAAHHRTGDAWCIYPMYDYAHGQSDALEGITHSICTLEFEDHRPLYDWFVEQLGALGSLPAQQGKVAAKPGRPTQIEFAKLQLSYTVLSKRNLLRLVQTGHVSGWDDPRMPTLAGMRRRGYTPEAIRAFCERVGVSKRESVVDIALFEHIQREDLNARCERRMAVLRPLRLVIENYPDGAEEQFEAENHPEHPELGRRKVPFSRVLYVERDDFREDAPKKWFRLSPGREVRLRYACLITCKQVIKDAAGEVVELRCTWDEASRGGNAPDGRSVRGTLHWVSAKHAVDAEVRLYDRLFDEEDPMSAPEGQDFMANLNSSSLDTLSGCKLEPSLGAAGQGAQYQFERMGYFCVDAASAPGKPVWNRTLTLKDSWAKIEQKLGR
jgi:glutaminyl-tRNA synthetase